MKSVKCLLLAPALCVVASVGCGASLTSQPCSVQGDPASSLVWKTIFETESNLVLVWPEGAVSARLTTAVGGVVQSQETIADTSLGSWPFVVPALPTKEADERVYDLTLEFLDAQSAVLKTQTASLGLVRGADGRTARFVRNGEQSSKWPRLKSDTAVLPIPAGATELTVDGGDPVAVTAPGWQYLKASGVHELALLVGADAWAATIEMGVRGTMILLR